MSVGGGRGGGGGGGKYATMHATCGGGLGRYTSVVDRYTPGMVRYGSRSDRSTPSELELAHGCRSFLLSRLKAAEVLGRQRGGGCSGAALSCRGGDRGRSPMHQAPAPPPPPPRSMPPSTDGVNFAFEQIRTKLLDLIEADIAVIRQLLTVGEQLEEIKWQRNCAGAGRGGGGSTSVDMSLADIESVDLDPYMTYLTSSNKRLEDDVTNGDDTDDVFRNDDTGGCLTKTTTCSVQSNELRLTLTRSGNGVKVNSSDNPAPSKPLLTIPGDSKFLNKMTKVEIQVIGSHERGNKSIPKSQNDFSTAKEKHEMTEVHLEIPGTKEKEKETTKSSTPALEFRPMNVQRNKDSDHQNRGQRSRHEPNNNNHNAPSLPSSSSSEAANRRLNGGNRTAEVTKAQSSSSSSSSSFSSHHLRLGNQSKVHRPIKTEETKGEALDTSTVSVITHL